MIPELIVMEEKNIRTLTYVIPRYTAFVEAASFLIGRVSRNSLRNAFLSGAEQGYRQMLIRQDNLRARQWD